MLKVKIGVIGGTGLYDIDGMSDVKEININTPFGDPSDTIVTGKLNGIGIAFLPRHGRGHRILPGELPSRANIYALKSIGVEHIIAVNSAGSLSAVSFASMPVSAGSRSTAWRRALITSRCGRW